MADDKIVKKNPDILDDVKKIEKFKKAQILAEAINEIKQYAKDVLILKEKTDYLLEEIGITKEDSKRVIDYVNSLVKLTEADKKDIREKVKETKEEKEDKVEEKMEKNPYPLNQLMAGYSSPNTWATDNKYNANYTVSLGNSGLYKISI